MSVTDYLVKIAETGTAICYPNIPDTERFYILNLLNIFISLIFKPFLFIKIKKIIANRVATLQEKIKNETKIDVKDQILLTKKGLKLKSDEVLETIIEKENALSSTMNAGDNAVVRARPYFVNKNTFIKRFKLKC